MEPTRTRAHNLFPRVGLLDEPAGVGGACEGVCAFFPLIHKNIRGRGHETHPRQAAHTHTHTYRHARRHTRTRRARRSFALAGVQRDRAKKGRYTNKVASLRLACVGFVCARSNRVLVCEVVSTVWFVRFGEFLVCASNCSEQWKALCIRKVYFDDLCATVAVHSQ